MVKAEILVTFPAEAHADEKSGTGSYSTKRGTFGVERFHVTLQPVLPRSLQ